MPLALGRVISTGRADLARPRLPHIADCADFAERNGNWRCLARRATLVCMVLAACLLGTGCALLAVPPQTAALRAQVPPGLAPAFEKRSVPFFPQTPYHCGPAALATVLADAGLPADPDRLAQAVFLPAREGSLALEMLAGARRQGAVAMRLPGELTALLTEVAAGHPVVVLQNLGLAMAPRWHYAVVVGYDLPAGELLLRSGTTERERMALFTFEHTWARGGHWAMVALPPGRLAATVTEREAIAAAIGFERAAPPAQAAMAYRAVLQRWPGQLLAGFGLANSLHAAGESAQAVQVLQPLATQHDSAAAWNNLARMQQVLGDLAAARASAARAVARAEVVEPGWLAAARRTQEELASPAPGAASR